ncbi:DUF6266 family protein [Parapedobacter deserti]|uniref:DUF6266 family protein n=1 Tax=Parapedobacter deserti TaxID=1912957 RepID=A0ABV7JMS7_9SPHI
MNIISNRPDRKLSSEVDGRLAVRQRFKLASEFLMPVRRLIHRGFATKRKGKTAFGRAMSYVLLRAVEGDYPNQYVDPAKVRLSEGVLLNPALVEVTRQGRLINVEVASIGADLEGMNESWDDQLILCAYHPEQRVAGINEEPRRRDDGVVSLQLPPLLADKPVHLYLMVHDRAERRWSNSCYLGEF